MLGGAVVLSPQARGCILIGNHRKGFLHFVPAGAGVYLRPFPSDDEAQSYPRRRGGASDSPELPALLEKLSPQARG